MSNSAPLPRATAGETFQVVRPWGRFDQLATNTVATVKVITVMQGERLSLQRHAQRDELWHVLDDGIAVTLDETERLVAAGECVFVPRETVHRITNMGVAPARLVEVAFGTFDEEDIVRLSDDYGRP